MRERKTKEQMDKRIENDTEIARVSKGKVGDKALWRGMTKVAIPKLNLYMIIITYLNNNIITQPILLYPYKNKAYYSLATH